MYARERSKAGDGTQGLLAGMRTHVLVLSLLVLTAADTGIYGRFRKTHAGQGYVIETKSEGRVLEVKLVGQVATTNRTVAIIRTKPDLWVATGRLLSQEPVLSGTQLVAVVRGSLPAKRGDVVFLAPVPSRSPPAVREGEAAEKTRDTREGRDDDKHASPPADRQRIAHLAGESKSRDLSPPARTNSVPWGKSLSEWTDVLIEQQENDLAKVWLRRLQASVRTWRDGNDFRSQMCIESLRELGAEQSLPFLGLMYDLHRKKGDGAAASTCMAKIRKTGAPELIQRLEEDRAEQ